MKTILSKHNATILLPSLTKGTAMLAEQLKPEQWYWVRGSHGQLVPYRFHRISSRGTVCEAEFFVGSMLQRFSLSQVVAEAQMPRLPRNK